MLKMGPPCIFLYSRVMHDLHLIYTDLKPGNILLTFPEYVKVPDYKVSSRLPKHSSYYKRIPKLSAIKVIDFGNTIYDHLNQTYVVSTRYYRAPEVILGLGWTYTYDIWSVGCIFVELCSGLNGSSRRKKRIARDDETASFCHISRLNGASFANCIQH
ncbi:Serine/threonine-protein kinase AFC2 [Capsicum baccatum]|uniref:Serine/threonine-protein kinase AFC2 n=1 Tax=Capsicum baccatum TaxID=33114 RepID=A0A2G2WJH8_CAPBA|nr:Serine/threonine-protein kinase AFC2 [Capsicum baccatum]